MASTLREFMDERELNADEVAALLSERGVRTSQGNPVTAKLVNLRANVKPPQAWAEALNLSPLPDEGERSETRQTEHPPKAPDDARKQALLPSLQSPTRIAGAYRFLGGMLAAGADSPGIAKAWDDSADPIAALWIKAAEQSPWAARFVTFMNQGGAQADLGMAHLYLAGATLYVLGANIPGGDSVFAKYRGYRPIVPAPEPSANGPAPASAETPVGEPQG